MKWRHEKDLRKLKAMIGWRLMSDAPRTTNFPLTHCLSEPRGITPPTHSQHSRWLKSLPHATVQQGELLVSIPSSIALWKLTYPWGGNHLTWSGIMRPQIQMSIWTPSWLKRIYIPMMMWSYVVSSQRPSKGWHWPGMVDSQEANMKARRFNRQEITRNQMSPPFKEEVDSSVTGWSWSDALKFRTTMQSHSRMNRVSNM